MMLLDDCQLQQICFRVLGFRGFEIFHESKVWIKEKAPKAKDVNLQARKQRETKVAKLW